MLLWLSLTYNERKNTPWLYNSLEHYTSLFRPSKLQTTRQDYLRWLYWLPYWEAWYYNNIVWWQVHLPRRRAGGGSLHCGWEGLPDIQSWPSSSWVGQSSRPVTQRRRLGRKVSQLTSVNKKGNYIIPPGKI